MHLVIFYGLWALCVYECNIEWYQTLKIKNSKFVALDIVSKPKILFLIINFQNSTKYVFFLLSGFLFYYSLISLKNCLQCFGYLNHLQNKINYISLLTN